MLILRWKHNILLLLWFAASAVIVFIGVLIEHLGSHNWRLSQLLLDLLLRMFEADRRKCRLLTLLSVLILAMLIPRVAIAWVRRLIVESGEAARRRASALRLQRLQVWYVGVLLSAED